MFFEAKKLINVTQPVDCGAIPDQLCIFSTHASVIQNATGGTHTYLSDALSNILNKYLYYWILEKLQLVSQYIRS